MDGGSGLARAPLAGEGERAPSGLTFITASRSPAVRQAARRREAPVSPRRKSLSQRTTTSGLARPSLSIGAVEPPPNEVGEMPVARSSAALARSSDGGGERVRRTAGARRTGARPRKRELDDLAQPGSGTLPV